MKKALKILLLLLSLTFAGTAYARTPVVDLNNQDDEVDKLQNQIEKYENIVDDNNATVAGLKSQISQKNATIAAWKKVLKSNNPSIAIISPTAGKNINSKDTLEVKWRGTNLSGASIDFYLSKKAELSSSTTDTILISNAVNTGSATLTIPDALANGSYFLTLVARDLTFNGQPVQRTLKKPLKVVDKTTKSIRVTSLASTSSMVQQGGRLLVVFDTTNIANGVDLGVYLTNTNVNDMTGATLLATVNNIQGVKNMNVTLPASTTLGVHKIAVAIKDATSTVGYSIQGVVVVARPPVPEIPPVVRTISISSQSNSTATQRGAKINVVFDTKHITNGTNMGIYLTSGISNDLTGATLLDTVKLNILGVQTFKVTIPDGASLGEHKIAVLAQIYALHASSTVGYSTGTVLVVEKPSVAKTIRVTSPAVGVKVKAGLANALVVKAAVSASIGDLEKVKINLLNSLNG